MSPTSVRRLVIVGVLVLLFGAVWGATRLGSLPPADYVVVNNTEVETLDPAQSQGVPEGRVIWSLFEGLCVPDPKDLSPQPGIAERWEILDGGKRYLFHLRSNAKWSDGTPLTATDVVWSLRRMLHPSTAAQYSYELWYVTNAGRYTKQDVKVGDAVEVQIARAGLSADDEKLATEAPFDRNAVLLHGTLKSHVAESKRYEVEIAGKFRTFVVGAKTDAADAAESAAWVLPDFETVAIRALDPRTVEIKLDNPTPYFLEVLAMYPFAPVQQACIEAHGHEWTQAGKMLSNGPYVLALRRFRERIRVVKNPHYWDAANVALNTVDFLSSGGQNTGLNLYLTGQADWIEKVPGSIVTDLLRDYPDDFQPAPYITTYFYRVNMTDPLMKNKSLKKALNAALDKRAICEQIARGGQTPARNIVSPVIDDHLPALCEDFDPEVARRHLEQAKRELVADGVLKTLESPIVLKLQFNNNSENHQAIAEFVQNQWQTHLGVKAELHSLEWGTYQKNQNDLTYQVSRAGWVGDYKDAMTFLKMFTSDSTQSNTGWKNDRFDELIKQAEREGDHERRRSILHDAEAILMEELPLIPVYFDVTNSMSKPYFKGVYPNFHDIHPVKAISIDQDAKARYRLGGKPAEVAP